MAINKGGKPRQFKTEEEFIECYLEFIFDIVQNDFELVPTSTRFCMWYADKYKNLDRKTVYLTTNKYYPNLKKKVNLLLADTIVEGAMKGHYNNTMCIFTLKNWCEWKDKLESDVNEELMKKLDGVLSKITS